MSSGRKWIKRRQAYQPVLLLMLLILYITVMKQIQDAVKRYSYLLGQTDLFKHFVDIKVRNAWN